MSEIENPLLGLIDHGQSYWLDNLTREKIRSGELERRVTREGLRGLTSNPSIFHEAVSGSEDYDALIDRAAKDGKSAYEIYEALVLADIRDACDVLRPVYDESDGLDGYVSLELSPYLAHDTEGSMRDARRLFFEVDRPNLLIKIPGTPAGVPAIEQMLYEGVNVNVTLLFSIERYRAVAEAYLRALERRLSEGDAIDGVASVASFFLSRIDVLVDQLLSHRIRFGESGEPSGDASVSPEDLMGKAAIANAKLAHQSFLELLDSDRWKRLEEAGARPQRLLWASTSTKDPLYSDVRYVEPLIGPHTVNTMPDRTIAAFADHGVVEDTLTGGVDEARRTFEALDDVGIDMAAVTEQLMNEGVQKFMDSFDALLTTITDERARSLRVGGEPEPSDLGTEAPHVDAIVESLTTRRFSRRLHDKDASLWTRDP
ncbi:MAG: transaldolase, partial [Gemmatimonadetes bacterium]|nr:transaldolase [Gemmatimonadota bacterium]